MRLIVCFKQVPDTSSRLRVEPGELDPHCVGLLPVVSPYDEFALEAAMQQIRGTARSMGITVG